MLLIVPIFLINLDSFILMIVLFQLLVLFPLLRPRLLLRQHLRSLLFIAFLLLLIIIIIIIMIDVDLPTVALITGKEKHDQVALKLLPNCFPNRPKMVPKSSQKGSQEALGTLPGGSWDPPGRPGATQEHPKSTKMRRRPAQERPKSASPREMVPQRAPKMDLKSIKMGIKIEVDFRIVF